MPGRPATMTIIFIILLILALVLWIPLVAGSASMRRSDAAGNALGHAFTVFYEVGGGFCWQLPC